MTERFTTGEAESLALLHFGIDGHAFELGGERTQNFRISAGDGDTFTLKVSDPNEDASGSRLESAALLHLEQVAPEILAPRLIPALNGEEMIALGPQDGRHLRLLTYLEGTPLSAIGETSPNFRRSLGQAVAALDTALSSFEHPFARERDLIWDVKNIAKVRPFLELIDAARRPFAEAMLSRFETVAGPYLARLPSQTVHSDMNGQNILAATDDSSGFAGFLDFGDLVHAPRIVDLAGAALLQMSGVPDDAERVADVIEGYHSVAQLEDIERALLPEFMIARCVINVGVTEFLASRDPANRRYIMKNNAASWMRLQRLSGQPHQHSGTSGETKVMS